MNEIEINALRAQEKQICQQNTVQDWAGKCLALNLKKAPPPRDLETGKPLIHEGVRWADLRSPDGTLRVEIDWS